MERDDEKPRVESPDENKNIDQAEEQMGGNGEDKTLHRRNLHPQLHKFFRHRGKVVERLLTYYQTAIGS